MQALKRTLDLHGQTPSELGPDAWRLFMISCLKPCIQLLMQITCVCLAPRMHLMFTFNRILKCTQYLTAIPLMDIS
jgi:hypothetical protein